MQFMKVYLVNIDTRKTARDELLGPFSSFEDAQNAIRELYYWYNGDIADHKEYNSDFSKGQIYTEEESVEILEREVKQ